MDGNVVPIGKVLTNRLRADRIVGGDVVESLVGKHDAPTERVVGPVALEHSDVMRAVAQLDADGRIEPCRAAAETRDLHADAALPTPSKMALPANYFKLKYLTLKLSPSPPAGFRLSVRCVLWLWPTTVFPSKPRNWRNDQAHPHRRRCDRRRSGPLWRTALLCPPRHRELQDFPRAGRGRRRTDFGAA